MHVSRRNIAEITIHYPETGDAVAATLTDEAPGKGRLLLAGPGLSVTCFWNSMGNLTVAEFYLKNSDSYIAGCLDPFGTLFRKIDSATLILAVVKDIEASTSFDDEQKVILTERTAEFGPISDVNGLYALNNELMTIIYGPMWVNQVNERFLGQHPLYTNLLARIATVRKVLEG